VDCLVACSPRHRPNHEVFGDKVRSIHDYAALGIEIPQVIDSRCQRMPARISQAIWIPGQGKERIAADDICRISSQPAVGEVMKSLLIWLFDASEYNKSQLQSTTIQ
jgi:hypothetical protein